MHSRRSALASIAVAGITVPFLTGCTATEETTSNPTHGGVSPVSGATSAPSTALRVVDVRTHGAAGDGSTDDHAAVSAAIAEVQDRRTGGAAGGVVYFPPGVYLVKRPLALRKNIYLVGESAPSSRLVYGGAGTGAFLTFGKAKDIDTYSGVRALWVDGGGRVNTTIAMHGPQEGSYLSEAIVTGARRIAVDVEAVDTEGGSNKFVIEKCWLWTTGDSGIAGVRLTRGGPISIRDTTAVGTNRKKPAPANSAGLIVTRSAVVSVENMNVEWFESHTYVDRTDLELRNPTGFFNRFGVKTSAASTGTVLAVTNASFDRAQSCILDQGAGVTLKYARTYVSEAYKHDQRHFRRNFWELGSSNVYQSARAQATMGFTSGATDDTSRFKFSTLTSRGWQEAAFIDPQGRFGSAGSEYDGAHLRMGGYHLWIDRSGGLRIKNGVPTSDSDGRAIGG